MFPPEATTPRSRTRSIMPGRFACWDELLHVIWDVSEWEGYLCQAERVGVCCPALHCVNEADWYGMKERGSGWETWYAVRRADVL